MQNVNIINIYNIISTIMIKHLKVSGSHYEVGYQVGAAVPQSVCHAPRAQLGVATRQEIRAHVSQLPRGHAATQVRLHEDTVALLRHTLPHYIRCLHFAFRAEKCVMTTSVLSNDN